jgi:hypothetical protein
MLDITVDPCTFCYQSGEVVAPLVSLRMEFDFLPGRGTLHDGLLVQADRIFACATHLDSIVRIAKIALDNALERVRAGLAARDRGTLSDKSQDTIARRHAR